MNARLLFVVALSAGLAAAQNLPVKGEFRTDLSKRSIDLAELTGGGPPKDGIPAIDEPQFVSPEQASAWLGDGEPVLLIEIDGNARLYPFQILLYHELVNDVIAGRPVLASYCPLCNSAVAFDRRIGAETLSFGVSGLLRHSDMVMYDRQTDSLWQQLTGEAIVGEHTGARLEVVSSQVVDFGTIREQRPAMKVLNRPTGLRPYGRSPYAGYEFGRGPMPAASSGPGAQLQATDRLIAIESGDEVKAYPLETVKKRGAVKGKIGGEEFVIFYDPVMQTVMDEPNIRDGRAVGTVGVFRTALDGDRLRFREKKGRILDRETASEWNVLGQAVSGPLAGKRLEPVQHGVFYAFAWLAFRPETVLVGVRSAAEDSFGTPGPTSPRPNPPGAPPR